MVQELLAARISLTPRPVQSRPAALETAFLGHCPGRARIDRLLAMPQLLSELRSSGYGEQIDNLIAGSTDESLQVLEHLPLPIRSSAEFHDIFPDAAQTPCRYRSILAGDQAWLPAAVDDYFANGGIKLWIVKIPQAQQQNGFFPSEDTQLHNVNSLRGLATLMIINSIGSIALPDLERLQLPAQLPDVPRVRLRNPDPQFRPCSTDLSDDHRERRSSNDIDMLNMPDPIAFSHLLQGLLRWTSRHRRDWQLLYTMPLSYTNTLNSPCLDPVATSSLQAIKQTEHAHRLRQLQCVFPYLRGPSFKLRSAVGAIAGKQASRAQQIGVWASIADQALQLNARPYPVLSTADTTALRQQPGISVFHFKRDYLRLDDERLTVPALPADDIKTTVNDSRYEGYRSAEIQRFLGFIQRAMLSLGEQLIFNVDYRDPRPRLLLDRYFRDLYQRGALRGATADDAFSIRQIPSHEGIMLFEIEIAPAIPIERMHITFNNVNGQWQGDLSLSRINNGIGG